MSAMQLKYVTLRDPSLPHQVIIYCQGGNSRSLLLSCNCLLYKPHKSGYENAHIAMGEIRTLSEARELYNDPALHNKPFKEEDEAKW